MSRLLDTLPGLVVDEQVQRLDRAFPGARRPALDGFAGELRSTLQGWTAPEFVAAVAAVIASERSFPRIATLIRYRPERPAPARGTDSSRCARCGVEPYLAGWERTDGTVIPRYRCDCASYHLGPWATPRARAWAEQDPATRGVA